jgi:23S rRNA (guanosine2251-2'-O)-methyltransferase
MRKLKVTELNRIDIDQFKASAKTPLVVVLDNVRSMHNVGSVFRTADAFRLEAVVLCGITACPPHAEIHKTALGAEESVDWTYYSDSDEAVKKLRSKGYEVYALEQVEGSIPLQDFKAVPERRYAIVLGNEVKGVGQSTVNLCDGAIEIPQYGTKHSLNVSVSGGMAIWHVASQLLGIVK